MIDTQLTIPPLELASAALASAFEKGFSNTPHEDETWKKVQRISLHCLTTGIIILELPEKTEYRRIPPKMLEKFKVMAVDNPAELHSLADTIMEQLRNDPKAFQPQFKVVLCGCLEDHKFTWRKALRSYTLAENGIPSQPRDIYDVVFREYPPHGMVAQVLVEADTAEYVSFKAQEFLNRGLDEIQTYDEILIGYFDNRKVVQVAEKMKGVQIPNNVLWTFKLKILEVPFFKEYIEEKYINGKPEDDPLAEEFKQLIRIY